MQKLCETSFGEPWGLDDALCLAGYYKLTFYGEDDKVYQALAFTKSGYDGSDPGYVALTGATVDPNNESSANAVAEPLYWEWLTCGEIFQGIQELF
jgi:hypothetical protein